MTYEKKSVIELREIAKERKIKGISTLKKKELIEVLENYDQEQSKQKEEPQIQREPKQSYSEHQERKHHQKEFPKNNKALNFSLWVLIRIAPVKMSPVFKLNLRI